MRHSLTIRLIALCTAAQFASGCEAPQAPETPQDGGDVTYAKGSVGKADASIEAMFVDFDFDGELVMESCFSARRRIEDQMLYTIGQLNGIDGVGRIDTLDVTDIQTNEDDGACTVTYHARMLVAWAKRHQLRQDYALILPRDMSHAGIDAFVESYSHSCVDWGAHDVDAGSFWYYWRPESSRCNVADSDVVRLPVKVTESPVHTSGKYPEYHKVWEDDALNIVAIFGKVKDGGGASDQGVQGYNTFIKRLTTLAERWDLVTVPEELPSAPGVDVPHVTINATLFDGKTIRADIMLVDSVKSAGDEFFATYESLTPDSDLIIYNGHAGLGANIRTLARKGSWQTGQYCIVFMNGCDTYAYADSALADAHADVNDDDPEGTKYLDMMMNALPSYFVKMPQATMSIIEGLLDYDEPRTYEQIFRGIDKHEMVIVSGEHDNVYVPGYTGNEGAGDWSWDGLSESGTVGRNEEARFETTALEPGRYRFSMTGTGDADLHVRVGEGPTLDLYDCRPYAVGSKENCEVDLNTSTSIHIMVNGWSDSSEFTLVGERVATDE
ncbi:MAG: PPC domain-containing protein [Myxococcota bacterium]